jgi:hypothetical protein
MRFVREFVCLLAIVSLVALPIVGAGCGDQSAPKPAATSEPKVDLGKKEDGKPASPKSSKKARSADESGSTTGALGVKAPKAPATDKSK